jgi:hypothetical protein
MIVIDYNGIAIGNIVVQKLAIDENLIRHMILNSIRMYRKKFKEYGDVVIVADGANNWRRDAYPEYKANRKKSRDQSSIDWDEVFRITNMVRDEIAENFPYKVMHVDGCEADDVIAQLAIETQEFGKYEDVMIVSADKDFAQLQTYNNIKQFSPMTKKFIKEENPRLRLIEHILTGDTSDGVPNVLSDDKVFVEGRRQTPLSKKKKELLIETEGKGLGDDVYRNYLRNQRLIDLTMCPESIKSEIINTFEEQDPWHNKGKVFPYLVQKRCRRLIEDIGDFIS